MGGLEFVVGREEALLARIPVTAQGSVSVRAIMVNHARHRPKILGSIQGRDKDRNAHEDCSHRARTSTGTEAAGGVAEQAATSVTATKRRWGRR
jgi:hypothetical protein